MDILRATRVCREDWFAEVPSGCEWVGDATTRLEVVAETVGEDGEGVETLEMSGCVVARAGARVVLSCGGLIVSVPAGIVGADVVDDACVVFTRAA